MSAGETRKVMQSALDQWVAIEQITDVAKRVLPPEECRKIDNTAKVGAERTLHQLDAQQKRKTPQPAPRTDDALPPIEDGIADEITELREIREVLERQVGE